MAIKSTFLILLLGIFTISLAQQTGDMVLFSENGEKFTVYLNNIIQNQEPKANVKVTGLNKEFYKARIDFEDDNIGEVNKNLYVHLGYEITYMVKLAKNGTYTARLRGEVPLAEVVNTPSQEVIPVVTSAPPPAQPKSSSQTISTTTTTTTTNEGANVNVGVPGMNIGVKVDAYENGGGVQINMNEDVAVQNKVSTTTTVTTTTTTSEEDQWEENWNNTTQQGEVVTQSYLPGYNGAVGCDQQPMSSTDFQQAKQSIGKASFSDSKMKIAEQVMRSNCLLTDQVKEIALLFTFEDDKLEFVKKAHSRTYDIGNYYKINDVFEFESSIDELDEYLSK